MGMMLRRHKRTPEYVPTVNGKPVERKPRKSTATATPTSTQPQMPNYQYTRK